MTESELMNSIRMELSHYGIVLRLNNGVFYTKDGRPIKSGLPKGTSDLLFVGDGFIAFLEVKTDKGITSDEQTNFIKAMRNLGHQAGVVRSTEEAIILVGISGVK